MIPVINLLCIAVFAYTGSNARKSLRSVVTMIATNPLILACALGLLWNNLAWELPGLLASILRLLSATALPLGLLAVGAGVHVGALRNASTPFFLSSIIKLIIVPSIAYMLCLITGQDTHVTVVVVILASLPTASSAYILARELGGDSQLMAAIITGQTLLAMISMPLVIHLLH
jgi:malonate transporter and related proteins